MDQAISISKSKVATLALTLFLALTGWWIYLNFLTEASSIALQLWAATYQVIAILGGIAGFTIAKQWGGRTSTIGRAILAFSIGLLLQAFGQSVYSYYIFYQHIEVPYPSLGDLGFFGTIPAYLYGTLLLAHALRMKSSLRSLSNKFWAFLIPVALLAGAYFAFLQDYDFTATSPLKIFLDFGYPLGQAMYVSAAIMTLLFTYTILGGIMRKPILALIFALVFQYASDCTFLYQASRGVWSAGGLNDYLYLASYLLMTLAIIRIGQTSKQISEV
jgi:hypothetical protein